MKQTIGKKEAELRQKQRAIDRIYGKLAAGSLLTDPELGGALTEAFARIVALEEQSASRERDDGKRSYPSSK
jgi:hypothetical protein